jgi:biopolymer transport protein ExbB
MSAASATAESRIRQRVSYLATVSSLATMIGLLGTVYGLILAFSALGDSSAGERAQRLSEGISTAMATTAYGLLVGIPALAAHAWLQARVERLLAALESSAGQLVLGLRRS